MSKQKTTGFDAVFGEIFKQKIEIEEVDEKITAPKGALSEIVKTDSEEEKSYENQLEKAFTKKKNENSESPVKHNKAKNEQLPIKATKLKDANKKITITARVSPDFLRVIKLYCIENYYKDKELIYESVSSVIGYDGKEAKALKGNKLLKLKTSIDMPMVYGRFDKDFNRAIERYCFEHKCTKQGLVAQAIADKVGYNK